MIIAVSGMHLKEKSTGIANLVIKTVNSWALWNNVKVIIYCNTNLSKSCLERLSSNVEISIIPMVGGKNNTTIWFYYRLGQIINKTKPDLFFCPTPWIPAFISKKQKIMIVVHDFVSKDFSYTMKTSTMMACKIFEKKAIKRANLIWAVSNYTCNKLCEYYPFVKEKPIFIGNGTDDSIKYKSVCTEEERNNLNKKLGIKSRYMLFVGTLEPRKNLRYLLSIFPRLHKLSNLDLVIVGGKGWGKTGIRDIIETQNYPKDNIVFSGYIDDEEIAKLYSGAELFISTSLNEGFGLPQVEAMTCGCPVVTAKNSAMIEVVDGAGVAVNGWDCINWENAVLYTINNRDEIIEKQMSRVLYYKWEAVMNRLKEFLNNNLIP